ncbi:hypothetical protein SAMN02927914_04449 [Mesorhizobium qingshengii]|uniref:Uncharacterized protein n=1 Tax=Mesorhizobium qingshengii TaxID=1165689 RepID=A0A1G5Z8G0_9HYPH|nr:hypothetical protein SAMN02927914_04449 [Mesorhizobium qingshengii]
MEFADDIDAGAQNSLSDLVVFARAKVGLGQIAASHHDLGGGIGLIKVVFAQSVALFSRRLIKIFQPRSVSPNYP